MIAGLQTYDIILIVSFMILIGLFIGRVVERLSIPNISGYLMVGIAFGIILTFFEYDGLLDLFMYLTKFGLGFIALSIGLELDLKKIWARRNEVLIVTLSQAILVFIFTSLGLFIFGMDLHIALLLGSIAIATEPGPILFLTKRYKTKGEITDTLVPLHGVEDAFAIIIFGITLSYAIAIDSGSGLSLSMILHGPIYELLFSGLIGVFIGVTLRTIIKKLDYKDVDKDMVVFVSAVVAILISIAFANRGFSFFGVDVHLSPVLLPMVVGITFTNTSSKLAKKETEHMIDLFSPPILIGFFTIIGAEMVFLIYNELANVALGSFLIFVSVYIIFRIIGKLGGSYLGGMLAKSSKNLRKYLGFCLLPQAQAALGLAFYARSRLSDTTQGTMLVLIVIVGTLVYELFGPFGLRHSLIRCEEVDENGACIIRVKNINKLP